MSAGSAGQVEKVLHELRRACA